MLRQSLKELLQGHQTPIPEKWAMLRPDALTPVEFVYLTRDLFGTVGSPENSAADSGLGVAEAYRSDPIWRKQLDLSALGIQEDDEEDSDDDSEDTD